MNRNNWFSFITLAIVMAMLVGCSGSKTSSNKPKDSGNSEELASSADNVNKEGFPIVKEPIELSFFTGRFEQNLDQYEETLVFKTYAEKTGIKVNFEEVTFGTLTEKRNLALTSGDYPDAFYSSRIPAADLFKYGKQGIFIPLNDLIDEYAPNIKAVMEKHPDIKKGLTMPDGKIYSIPSYYSPEFLPMLIGKPIWIKQPWLEQLGMEEPKTTEEFYNFLKAIKETDLNGNGKHDEIPFAAEGMNELVDHMKGAWGFGTRGLANKYVDVDPKSGDLRFFRIDPKYKEMLQYVNKLYSEGLIDQEIYTIDSANYNAKGAEGRYGATISPNPETVMNQSDYVGMGTLKGPHGDQLFSHVKAPLVHVGAFAITDKNKHPEATIRWIDHFFSEEGATFEFMGIEGETYTVNDKGEYEFVEEITNNPDGLTFDQALTPYVTWMGGSYPGYVQHKYFKGSESLPNAVAVGEKVKATIPEEIWNAFNYTEDEIDFLQSIGSDIHTYLDEMEAKFITGEVSFDKWDNHVKQVENMNIDQYLEVTKAAYERYESN
ncbi:extracellular solute-binding protein [Lederbergia ruris]|uniref:extracellular solute-binding protein n=1 Tax=Lederbergia ruris TaxID=217495 RepID=UPI0039A0C23E